MSDDYVTCAVCGKLLKGFINPSHLRMHGMNVDDYRKIDPDARFTKITGWNKGLTKETSESMRKSSASHKTEGYRQRYESTMVDRYGVTNPAKDEATMRRIISGMKKTNLERYGVENWGQTEAGRKTTSMIGKRSCATFRKSYDETGYRTEYERMFHEMNPQMRCNDRILTGNPCGIAGKAAWYSPDFIDDATNVIYEIDGDYHTPERDAVRDEFYRSRGYEVIRYTNDQVAAMYEAWRSQEQDIV